MTSHSLIALTLLCLPLGAQSKSKAKVAAPIPAPALEPAPKANWNGTWTLVAGESDVLDTRVDEFIKDMNFLQKQLWKRKLAKACKGFTKCMVLDGQVVSISFDKELPLNTAMDGTASTWTHSDGTKYETSGARKGDTIVQTLQGDGYSLSYTYLMRKDGQTLVLQASYASPKLPDSFLFKQVFRKND